MIPKEKLLMKIEVHILNIIKHIVKHSLVNLIKLIQTITSIQRILKLKKFLLAIKMLKNDLTTIK